LLPKRPREGLTSVCSAGIAGLTPRGRRPFARITDGLTVLASSQPAL